jgi:uncharacterized protein
MKPSLGRIGLGVLLVLLAACVQAPPPAANPEGVTKLEVSIPSMNSTYTQNFDFLSSAGANNPWTNDATLLGWYSNRTSYLANTGSNTTGGLHSFGNTTTPADRALGSIGSNNSGTIYYGVRLKNETGSVITGLNIAYTGEQWRNGGNTTQHRLNFAYQTGSTVTNLTAGTWTDVDALDFAGPIATATAGVLDGNVLSNRTAITGQIPLTLNPGEEVMLRWEDPNDTGNDHGLAIDDLSVSVLDPAPAVASVVPVNGATEVAPAANLSVNFSEPVNVSSTAFSLNCSVSGARTFVVSGGPTTFTLNPDSNFVDGDNCTLTVDAGQVSDQDTNDPPDNMAVNFISSFSVVDVCLLPFTAIPAIQGSGAIAALTGTRTTKGVVVGDYEYPGSGSTNAFLRGFYIQDISGDSNPTTSDAIFVFNGNTDSVALGDVVRVVGTVGEFQDQTQISSVTALTKCGVASVSPVDVTLPFASSTDAERFEGMLVRLPQTLYVTEHFQLGRFGQVVLSSGGRLEQPTNVVAPGAPALALQAANNLNRIILDDASQAQNPDPILFGRGGNPLSATNTLRGGDTATGIVGVMTYTWAGSAASGNAYRVRPINALGGLVNFQAANPRPTSAPAVGGTLKVVGMNLLNFFNTFDGASSNPPFACSFGVGGGLTDCRGADDATEFARQWPKTVAAILTLNPDVLGFNEMENDGYGPDSAIAFLVDQLNAATAPGTYAFIDADAATTQVNALGTDAIKVGLIYKPARVSPVGQTAVLNDPFFVNAGDSAPRNRASLSQAFQQNSNGAVFIANVNHFKSKGSACDAPDAGDGQGNCNAVRTNAAILLMSWLNSNPTGIADPDVLLIGDYNSYAKEDPIIAFLSAGFINLIENRLGPDAYSYVFDGQWGYLDHALSSSSLNAQVTGVADYHINADEPGVLDYNVNFKSVGQLTSLYAPDQFRVSDHDPVLVGLNLNAVAWFRNPVSNFPIFNVVNSGQSIPVKFSLGGNKGLDIFAAGYPKSQTVVCNSTNPVNGLEATESNSGLTYDAASDQYTYVWKTDKVWRDSCRQLVVRYKDGTTYRANFNFTR